MLLTYIVSTKKWEKWDKFDNAASWLIRGQITEVLFRKVGQSPMRVQCEVAKFSSKPKHLVGFSIQIQHTLHDYNLKFWRRVVRLRILNLSSYRFNRILILWMKRVIIVLGLVQGFILYRTIFLGGQFSGNQLHIKEYKCQCQEFQFWKK